MDRGGWSCGCATGGTLAVSIEATRPECHPAVSLLARRELVSNTRLPMIQTHPRKQPREPKKPNPTFPGCPLGFLPHLLSDYGGSKSGTTSTGHTRLLEEDGVAFSRPCLIFPSIRKASLLPPCAQREKRVGLISFFSWLVTGGCAFALHMRREARDSAGQGCRRNTLAHAVIDIRLWKDRWKHWILPRLEPRSQEN